MFCSLARGIVVGRNYLCSGSQQKTEEFITQLDPWKAWSMFVGDVFQEGLVIHVLFLLSPQDVWFLHAFTAQSATLSGEEEAKLFGFFVYVVKQTSIYH